MSKQRPHKHPKIVFDSRNFYKDPRTGYYYHTLRSGKKELLHREIWKVKKGEIPKGFVMHHIDYDKENNELSNLQCMDRAAHQRLHALADAWSGSEANLKQLASVNHLAKAWHSSPEGIAWHTAHGKKCWENRKYTKKECTVCSKEYLTPCPTRSKYCHPNCKQRALQRRRRNVPIED